MLSRIGYAFSVLLAVAASATMGICQEKNFRRHFIIAYDVSSPFISAERATPSYKQSVIHLFSNQTGSGFELANHNNLLLEKSNGISFFDPERDEISFFHFNVARSEFPFLMSYNQSPGEKIISVFDSVFLKNKKKNWSQYKRDHGTDVGNYFQALFATPQVPPVFGKGVTMSNFVYPLVLNKIDTSTAAQEYIVILLSDFLTGSMLGNKNDFNRLKESFGYPGGLMAPEGSAPVIVKAFLDQLADKYYKIDFFEYAFPANPQIGIIGYKVKPKAGNRKPEDLAVFIDNDLKLSQTGYGKPYFKISEALIRFTHNKDLEPREVFLRIAAVTNDSETTIFDTVVASKQNDEWVSPYTSSGKLMQFDSLKSSYLVPRMSLDIGSLTAGRNFDYLKLTYSVNTSYQASQANSLNYIYITEKQIFPGSISFSTRTKTLIMLYGIPAVVLLALAVYLIFYGKPRRISIEIEPYLDSYQVIDYNKFGKLLTQYKFWDVNTENLPASLQVGYRSRNFLFNWKPVVRLTLSDIVLPPGFEIFLKQDLSFVQEYRPGLAMPLKLTRGKNAGFWVCIRQNDMNARITSPQLVKFTVQAAIQHQVLFAKSNVFGATPHKFHIGPELSDVWVGLDPGTSGSCITVGSHANNIMLAKNKSSNSSIISSKIVFDRRAERVAMNGVVPEDIYKTGELAQTLYDDTDRWTGFQSIKKLLGFKNKKEISFQDGNSLLLSGKELSGLLVKGLYGFLRQSIDPANPAHREYLDSSGQFNPLRAVIAIPNNFTLSKIQSVIECAQSLDQFKEIRYVYEAEAVLFYYLSNYRKFNPGPGEAESFDEETVMVFDMGGATINTTIVNAAKIEEEGGSVYSIDFLSKIGYGIGGDTIDYCIVKFLLGFSDEIPEFKAINEVAQKAALLSLAFDIKKAIVENFPKKYNYLITHYHLQSSINNHLNLSISIDEVGNFYSHFKKDSRGDFPLFTSPLFLKYIYGNVSDAVKEVLELSGKVVNKVIFSGRSSFFPFIKDAVRKQFEVRKKFPAFIDLSFDESKTAVAQGACWYGINKSAIRLNNLKTNASFGVLKTLSADTSDVLFIELAPMGSVFDIYSDDIGKFRGLHTMHDVFSFDGAKANFYQIMGKDAQRILAENQKHKFSKIASIQLPLAATQVAITVGEDDTVECRVELVSQEVRKANGVVSDQDIEDANEEHYTWAV